MRVRNKAVRHPPQSGWLDELGRLKGGWPMVLGVARCAPNYVTSELPTCSIRSILLADVVADLLQFEADSGYGVAASPEMLAACEVSFLAVQPGECDGALSFKKPITDATGRLGGIAIHICT